MIYRFFLLSLLYLCVFDNAYSESLDLNLNDDAARLIFAKDVTSRKLRVDAGWLHHQDRGDIASIGLQLVDFAASGSNPVTAGVGLKLFYLDTDFDLDGAVLALGGSLSYTLPQYNRIGFEGHVFFAPDVVAFGDATQYTEVAVRAKYNVLRDADIYLGLRNAQADFEGVDSFTFDTGFHVGLRIRF